MTISKHLLGLRSAFYTTADMAKAKAWYTEVLGYGPYFDEPFYMGFNVGGFELGVMPDGDGPATRAHPGIAYWGVPDAAAAHARLIALGAKQLDPVNDVGDGIKVGSVHDPFGNIFGVIENPHFKVET
jgi:predicted enzyme related to lactoylglutathione lyase